MNYTFDINGKLYTTSIHKEGKDYVATCIEVAVSDFGGTKQKALQNLAETTQEHLRAFPMDNLI